MSIVSEAEKYGSIYINGEGYISMTLYHWLTEASSTAESPEIKTYLTSTTLDQYAVIRKVMKL